MTGRLDQLRATRGRRLAQGRLADDAPSKGFMSASLAIVAQAPLVAERSSKNGLALLLFGKRSKRRPEDRGKEITSSERVMDTGLVTTHDVLDGLIGCKVDSMSRALSH